MDTKLAPELIDRFRADLEALVPDGLGRKRLGLAVSGGPDSVAMLLLAAEALQGQVFVASVDHGLRAESAGECELVAMLCAELGVSHTTLAVEVGVGNVQEQARQARYAALAEWAGENALDAVLTAHHEDDQVETLVMRLNRGSGVAGLAGVRASTTIPDSEIALLRPLLGWRKAELDAIVREAGIEVALDPSNSDDQFDRARIRMALSEADWLDVDATASSAAHLADAAEALDWVIEREFAENVTRAGESVAYQSSAPFYLQLRVVARMVESVADAPRQGALARMMRELADGGQGNIAGALVSRNSAGWTVSKEPPRRS